MNRTLVFVLGLLLCLVFVVGCVVNGDQDENGPVKIGVITPQTGDMASIGAQMKAVCEFLKDEVNAEGGINGRVLEFVYEDDAGTSSGAATAIRKLIDVDHIDALMGPLFTPCLLAVKDAVIEAELPALNGTSANNLIFGKGHEGNFLFTIDPDIGELSRLEMEFITKKMGYEKIALFSAQSDYATQTESCFNELAPEYGVEIVDSATFSTGTNDFRSDLTRLKASRAEVVFMAVEAADIVRIVRQMNELDLNDVFILTNNQAAQADVFAEIGSFIDGRFAYAVPGAASDDLTKGLYEDFVTKFVEVTGAECVESYQASFYDCGKIFVKAMRESGYITGKELRDYLVGDFGTFAGTVGYSKFLDDGLSSRNPAIMVYTNGKSVLSTVNGAN